MELKEANKNIGVVAGILAAKSIRFTDEDERVFKLCEDSPFIFIEDFQKPFIIYDTFADKTTRPETLIFIDIGVLEKHGLVIYSKVPYQRWFPNQKTAYVIGRKDFPIIGGKRVKSPPVKIQKDISNNKVRLIGANAGEPHYDAGGFGGCSPWIELGKEEKQLRIEI